MVNKFKIGLALSGGGFRAAAFHLGTLKKFYELNILDKVDYLSTISGGSIIGAYYLLKKDSFQDFEREFKEILHKSVILRILIAPLFIFKIIFFLSTVFIFFSLTNSLSWTIVFILLLIIFIGIFFYKIFPTTDLVKNIYNNLLFSNSLLGDLPTSPYLVINSTNLDTGTLFSFTRDKSFDSTYNFKFNKKIEFDTKKRFVAEAVACSTSVPYAFAPTHLKFKIDNDVIKPKLVDGGVYDNQGIYRLTSSNSQFKSDIVIVSDASYPFEKRYFKTNPLPVFSRIMNVMMKRIKSIQFLQRIYENDESELYEIAYFSIDYEYDRCLTGFVNAVIGNKIRPHLLKLHNITEEIRTDKNKLINHLKKTLNFDSLVLGGISKEEIESIKNIKTSLRSLTESEVDLLTRHAGVLTEIQLLLYCPSLIS